MKNLLDAAVLEHVELNTELKPAENYAKVDEIPFDIATQVVSGIGFLAGGVILREGLTVRGLNTAATLWCAVAIWSLSGAGLLLHAGIGTVAVLVANLILRPLGYRINQQPLKGTELELCYRCDVICRT